jgi:hypothetical protein
VFGGVLKEDKVVYYQSVLSHYQPIAAAAALRLL